MITLTHSTALILDVSIKFDKLVLSCSDEQTPFYQSEEIAFNLKAIENLCEEIRFLFNKSNASGRLSSGLLEELKKVCLILYDSLLSARVKDRLKKAGCVNLILRLDEPLIFIPWELLYNGEDFLCLVFNIGRRVTTTQSLVESFQRQPKLPLKMLMLADTSGDLPEARREIKNIRDQLDVNRDVLAVSAKTGAVTVDYVTRHIRDYDFVHFAGHTDDEANDPALSGWRLSDGRFTAAKIQKMSGGSSFPVFVFLNSCQSAFVTGEHVKDGYEQKCFGLVHAFLTAGVKHYIGTLWEIPDVVGEVVASEFYRHIKEGAAVGEALRQARRGTMQKFEGENIFWAGYVLYGDPKYIPFPRGLKSCVAESSHGKKSRKLFFSIIVGVLGLSIIAGVVGFELRKKSRFKPISLNSDHPVDQQFSANQIVEVSDDRLTQLTRPSMDDSVPIASLKQRLAQAWKENDHSVTAQTAFELAQMLKESLSEKMILPSPEQRYGLLNPVIADSYFVLLDLYRTAQQYADKVQDHQLEVKALLGSAEVNRWRKEFRAAIAADEKAVAILMSIQNQQELEHLFLISAYIDLAHLYALGNLDFVQAEESLNQIPALIKILQRSTQWPDLEPVIQRQSEQFLGELAKSPYANSHFANQAREMLEKK